MRLMEEDDREKIAGALNGSGYALVRSALSAVQCAEIAGFYAESGLFRSTINMERYRFGRGEYRYFSYPLPEVVKSLRETYYRLLVPVANEWMELLGSEVRYPASLEEFLAFCHERGQYRPTPLVLHYTEGCYNTLHQDMYGEVFFPFQVVFMLTEKGTDYAGGELVFVEQLPRAQSRAQVLTPGLGDAVIFTTNFRPVRGSRGYYRGKMKHGVSPVTQGERYTLGVIFHDAK